MFKVVLIIESSHKFGRDLLNGIAQYSCLHGPWTFYRIPFYLGPRPSFAVDYSLPPKELHYIKKWGADGIIMRHVKNTNAVLDLGLPTIVSRYASKKISRASDEHYLAKGGKKRANIVPMRSGNKKVGQMAAEHLLEKGLGCFAFCGYDDFFWSEDRKKGFCDKIKEAGFSVLVYKKPKTTKSRHWYNEQILLIQWLKSLPKPIGLMACNDERSQDIIEACRMANIHVSEHIALIGAGNDGLICNLANPPLSSVALNAIQAGYQAADVLECLMSGKANCANRQIIIQPTHVEQRLSTDIVSVNDPIIAAAVKFIRAYSHEPIQVNDVVRNAMTNRRNLELKFKTILGHSIHEVIDRVRCEHIEKLLLSSDLSLTEIMIKLHFSSKSNMVRFFHKAKGMSPLEYRRHHGRI